MDLAVFGTRIEKMFGILKIDYNTNQINSIINVTTNYELMNIAWSED
jgi:hypothetical protein